MLSVRLASLRQRKVRQGGCHEDAGVPSNRRVALSGPLEDPCAHRPVCSFRAPVLQ